MFTGIISNLGKLVKKEGSLFVFEVDSGFNQKLEHGTSVAINGVCLTVVKKPDESTFAVEIMPETGSKTMLGFLQMGDTVNLELPITLQDFLSGHLVQGHVDSTGKILKIEKDGNSRILTITLSKNLSNQAVEKGSIAINGISLTVISAYLESFTVGIIPFTWENTMLHTAKAGDLVNIETDVIGKYVERNLIKNEK